MKFGYTIAYVQDVPATLNFYQSAFGFHTRFLHDSNMYGELDTGATTLAFAHNDMRALNGVDTADNHIDQKAPGIEVAFVTPDVHDAYHQAVKMGAQAVQVPKEKPWGQTVAYVRDINGILVELCTPVEPPKDQ